MEGTRATTPTFEVDSRGIGWITFDDPDRSVNVLTEPVMRRLAGVVEEARAAASAGTARVIVVRSGKPGTFIAGADVDAIAELEDPAEAEAKVRLGQAIFLDVESLPVPTVAAIHGACMGGAPSWPWPARTGRCPMRTARRSGCRRSSSASCPRGAGRRGFPVWWG